jgi:23S rRNA pseudouridine955/2504/2580 synthase/23S rRNA pseudouridine1911/1915/1917 synthase
MLGMEILFENTDYVIVNKPSGVYSIPDHYGNPNSVLDFLRQRYEQVFTVHRIDKDTSGCIVFALNAEAHRHASMLFEAHEVHKVYACIVHGRLPQDNGRIEKPLMQHPSKQHLVVINDNYGKEAITNYSVVQAYKHYSLVQCVILTGRMHQIRVHMQHLGNPILCDPFYSNGNEFFISSIKRKYKMSDELESERPFLRRLALHAQQIKFTDEQGNTIEATAPHFKDLQATIKQLEKWDR